MKLKLFLVFYVGLSSIEISLYFRLNFDNKFFSQLTIDTCGLGVYDIAHVGAGLVFKLLCWERLRFPLSNSAI
jgi:hypothetical protein